MSRIILARVARGALLTVGALTGIAWCGLPAAPAHADAGEHSLRQIDEQVVEVPAPAPGEAQTWEFTVANTSKTERAAFVRLAAADGKLFSGSTPATVTVGLSGEAPVLQGPAAELVDAHSVALGRMPADTPLRISGTVALPRDAGNDYQAADGVLRVQLAVAGEASGTHTDTGAAEGWLAGATATTGSANWGWIAAVGMAGIVVGAVVITGRRERQPAEEYLVQGE